MERQDAEPARQRRGEAQAADVAAGERHAARLDEVEERRVLIEGHGEGREALPFEEREGAQPELRLVAVEAARHLGEEGDARREPERDEPEHERRFSSEAHARARGPAADTPRSRRAPRASTRRAARRRRGPPPGAPARAAAPALRPRRRRGGAERARATGAPPPAAPARRRAPGAPRRSRRRAPRGRGRPRGPASRRAARPGCLRRARAPRRAARGSSPAAQAAGARGSRTVKVLPFPGSLSTPTSPPWARAISRARASPMPAPGPVRGLPARTAVVGLEDELALGRLDPDPGVAPRARAAAWPPASSVTSTWMRPPSGV